MGKVVSRISHELMTKKKGNSKVLNGGFSLFDSEAEKKAL